MGRPLLSLNICFAFITLIAGGGSYYFAKRSINADKKARHEADMKRRHLTESLEYSAMVQPSYQKDHHKGTGQATSPSKEASASHDPALTAHTLDDTDPVIEEKSKFEPSKPYRAKKGDRFS